MNKNTKPFTINILENRLEIAGHSFQLQPKTLALFECLSESQGQVVSRDDIFDKVWPGAVVSETTLNRTVSDLRKALAPLEALAPPGHNIIETVPKRGYKLNLPQHTKVSSSPKFKPEKTLGLALMIFIISAFLVYFLNKEIIHESQPIKVEVKPFQDLSESGDLNFFSQALATEMESLFSSSSAFEVFHFNNADGKNLSRQTIRIEGQLFRDNQQLKLVARLIDLQNGKLIWSGTMEEVMTNAFEVQSKAAVMIYQAATTHLLPDVSNLSDKNKAQDLLHLATRDINTSTAVSLDRAIDKLQQASLLDPENAEIFANLSDAILLTHTIIGRTLSEQTLKRQKAALQKAVELAPDSAVTLSARGYDAYLEMNYELAHEYFSRAIELDSLLVEAYARKALLFRNMGQYQEAYPLQKKMVELVPTSANAFIALGRTSQELNLIEEAIVYYRQSIKLGPDNSRGYLYLAALLERLERIPEAKEIFEEGMKAVPDDPSLDVHYGMFLLNLDQLDAAKEHLQKAFADAPNYISVKYGKMLLNLYEGNIALMLAMADDWYKSNPNSFVSKARLAFVYWLLGDYTQALSLYETIDISTRRGEFALFNEHDLDYFGFNHGLILLDIYVRLDMKGKQTALINKNQAMFRHYSPYFRQYFSRMMEEAVIETAGNSELVSTSSNVDDSENSNVASANEATLLSPDWSRYWLIKHGPFGKTITQSLALIQTNQ